MIPVTEAAVTEGGVAVGERLPNLLKCELSLFHSTKLFIFALDEEETIRPLVREELRPSRGVTIKTGRRRYAYATYVYGWIRQRLHTSVDLIISSW